MRLHPALAAMAALAAPAPALAQASPADSAGIAAACGGEVQRDAFARLPRAERVKRLSCFTREAANRFNRTLPNKVDDATTLERVSAAGTTLTYHYKVNILRTELRPGALDAFKPTVKTKVCAAPDMSMIISVGGAYRYMWNDRAGEPIGDYLVDRC